MIESRTALIRCGDCKFWRIRDLPAVRGEPFGRCTRITPKRPQETEEDDPAVIDADEEGPPLVTRAWFGCPSGESAVELPDDAEAKVEGGLQIEIAVIASHVVVDFGKPVVWVGLGRQEAQGLAEILHERAQELPE